jgi:hypothetical protein
MADWLREGLGPRWTTRHADWRSIEDAVAALAPRAPLNRHACLSVDNWTLLLNNGPNGTDVGLLPSQAARELGCRAVRAVCAADAESPFPARILEVYGPNGEVPLALKRSIAAANDGGRWVFETSGQPFEFEDVKRYEQRSKSQRFTCDMVHSYLTQLGVPTVSKPDWATAVLVEQRRHR